MGRPRSIDLFELADAVSVGRLTRDEAWRDIKASVPSESVAIGVLHELDELLALGAPARANAQAKAQAQRTQVSGSSEPSDPASAFHPAGRPTAGSLHVARAADPSTRPAIRAARSRVDIQVQGLAAGIAVAVLMVIVAAAAFDPHLLPAETRTVPPVPSSTRGPTSSPTPTAAPISPSPVLSILPTLPSDELAYPPSVALWSVDRSGGLSIWRWTPVDGRLVRLVRLDATGEIGTNGLYERHVAISPTGAVALLLETAVAGDLPHSQLRAVDLRTARARTILDDATSPVSIAWSVTGNYFLVDEGLGEWTLHGSNPVHSAAQRWKTVDVRDHLGGSGGGLLGFSADGRMIYGFASDEAAPGWRTAVAVDMATGQARPVSGLPRPDRSGPGAASILAPRDGVFRIDPLDPHTARALVVPAELGNGASWRLYDGTSFTDLILPASDPATRPTFAWGPRGALTALISDGTGPVRFSRLVSILGGSAQAGLSPGFALPSGGYRADLVEQTRRGMAVILIAADPATIADVDGFDAAVLVNLADASATSLRWTAPAAAGQGIHFAGWLP